MPVVEELALSDEVPPAPGSRWRRVVALVVVGAVLTVAVAVWDQLRAVGPPSPAGQLDARAPHRPRRLGRRLRLDRGAGWRRPRRRSRRHRRRWPTPACRPLYLQTSPPPIGVDVLEPERLDEMIEQAHADGMHVVAWYLPTYTDVDGDLARLVASADLPVDGLARGHRVDGGRRPGGAQPPASSSCPAACGRRSRPSKAIAAITLSTVHVEVVNPAFWPGYPYAELGADYDALLPMAYWTPAHRRPAIERALHRRERRPPPRARRRPTSPIHVIGGIADEATAADLERDGRRARRTAT